MNATFSFTVNSKQANTTLLACLLPAIPYLQPEQWQALLLGEQNTLTGAITDTVTNIIKGTIEVDGVIVSKDVLLLAGQIVRYTINDYQEAEVDDTWSQIWSNDEISAIHKPANLPVNRTTRNVYNTLIQLLRRESPWPDAHLLHRLDLETSGLILIAQNNAMARQYQSKLKNIIKRKLYRAVVTGKPDWKIKDFICDLGTLDESQGGSAIRSQMHVLPKGEGKESRTLFNVLATQIKEGVSYSLIECELFTGRKHQIRAQLAHLGHAIVGDKIYSNGGAFYLKRLEKVLTDADYETLLTPHHLLHAYEIHLFNLWHLNDGLNEKDVLILQDDDFPESWHAFDF
ncbi:MAG: 23S rRNA pseudouridine1911/1915/1917 synthase [Glaciecola sp.]|jgi:23S rRNA pseudouridine1911/1915/1917 synthase